MYWGSEEIGDLLTGMLGLSAEDIPLDATGFCWFPTGEEDLRYTYGYKWEKHKITAVEDIRVNREVIVLDGERETVMEHTPVHAKVLGYIYDDYFIQAYTGTQIPYNIGTAANAADPTRPLAFIAERMFLMPTTNCLVRFAVNTGVQHLLIAGVQYFYMRQCSVIFIQQQTLPGSLTIRALGNEVGV